MIKYLSPQVKNESPFLNKLYNSFVSNLTHTLTTLDEEKWEIYNTISTLLLKYGYYKVNEQIKYRITGGEYPNDVFIDILEKNKEIPLFIATYVGNLKIIEEKDWIETFI